MLWIHDTTLRQPLSVWNNNLKPRHFLNPPTCSSHWRIYTAISEILSSEKIRKKKKKHETNKTAVKSEVSRDWIKIVVHWFIYPYLPGKCLHLSHPCLQFAIQTFCQKAWAQTWVTWAVLHSSWWVNWLLCVKPLSSLLQSFSCSLILFQLHKIVEASAFQLGLQFLLPNMHISLPPDHVIHMTVTGQPLVFSQSAK